MDNTQEGSEQTPFITEDPPQVTPDRDPHSPDTVAEGVQQTEANDTEEAGEIADMVSDATQETGEDDTAQSAEEDDMARAEVQPDVPVLAVQAQTKEQAPPAALDRVRTAEPADADHETQDSTPDSSDITETAGETGDVVLDSTQETGADQTAQSTEEEDLDVQASQQVDPGVLQGR